MHSRVLLSRKPGFLFSAFSRAFRWFSATTLVFLFIGFLPLQLNQIWWILCVMYGEDGAKLCSFICKNYTSLICLNVFFSNYNFGKNEIKSNISI
jgi:hypothetical protein